MRIAILEDSRHDRDRLLSFLSRYAGEKRLDIRADAFTHPDKMPDDMSAYAAAFFDIMLDQCDAGIKAARSLRSAGWNGALAFVTSSTDFYPEGFELNAVHYLIKPLAYGAFTETMGRFIHMGGKPKRAITMPVLRGEVTLTEDDILFAEVHDHITLLHTIQNRIRVNITLSALESRLTKGVFLRCFRSCVVNMAYIERMEEAHCVLTGGVRVPIRLRNRQEIYNQYLDYRSALSREVCGGLYQNG